MRKTIIALLAAAGCLAASAQTNVVSTNLWDSIGGTTNLAFCGYGIAGIGGNNTGKNWGGGVALLYNLTANFAPVVRVEYLNKAWYQASLTGQLHVPIHVTPTVDLVPFGLGGVSTTFGGGTDNGGTVQGIVGAGAAIKFAKFPHWDLVGDVEKWSALPGEWIRFGAIFKF